MAQSIFTSQTPVAGNVNDATQYTLGTVWTPNVNGVVTHIRVFAPASAPASAFVGVLYSVTSNTTGVELGRATFGALTPTAWNTVALSTPVLVTAGSYYAATYRTPDFFVLTTSFFTSSGVTNGNLTAIQSGSPYGNGRLHVGDGFPETTSAQQSNYFADIVFEVAVDGSGSAAAATTGTASALVSVLASGSAALATTGTLAAEFGIIGGGIPAGISGVAPLVVSGSRVGRIVAVTPSVIVQGSEGRRQ